MKFTHSFSSLLLAAALFLAGCSQQINYTDYVDPKIGTGDHGHVFVGANVPFGLVQVGPTSIPQDWDWCSGYHASDSTVIGFSHTHLSGTGIGDLFERTSHKIQIKPHTRKPCGKIGQQGPANTAHLLHAQNTAAQKAQSNIKNRHRNDSKDCINHIDADSQPQRNCKQIADNDLSEGNG